MNKQRDGQLQHVTGKISHLLFSLPSHKNVIFHYLLTVFDYLFVVSQYFLTIGECWDNPETDMEVHLLWRVNSRTFAVADGPVFIID